MKNCNYKCLKKNENIENVSIKDVVLEIEDQVIISWSASWVSGKVAEVAGKIRKKSRLLFLCFVSKCNKKK